MNPHRLRHLWLLLMLPWMLAAAATEPVHPTPVDAPTPAELGALRQQLLMHPDQASRYVHARPVYRNDNLLGYRISPGPEPAMFQRMGFQEGDVVTTINGMALTPANRLVLVATVSFAQHISVGLLRDGERQVLNFSLR